MSSTLVKISNEIPGIQLQLIGASHENPLKYPFISHKDSCYLRPETVKALKVAHASLQESGFTLVILNGYCPSGLQKLIKGKDYSKGTAVAAAAAKDGKIIDTNVLHEAMIKAGFIVHDRSQFELADGNKYPSLNIRPMGLPNGNMDHMFQAILWKRTHHC